MSADAIGARRVDLRRGLAVWQFAVWQVAFGTLPLALTLSGVALAAQP